MRFCLAFLSIFVTGLYATEPIQPLPQTIAYDRAKASLGKKLFFDSILSKDRTIACVSCHNVASNGANGTPLSLGIRAQKGNMNSPTVFNAAFNFTQFWNGRAKDLSQQALGPIHNPVEMGLALGEASARLQANTNYKKLFFNITKRTNITNQDIVVMIAEYEKTLITPNSKFDLYLQKKAVLSSEELQGYLLFKNLGCVSCHNGVNIGGNSFQKMGAIAPIPRAKNVDDRFVVTHRERDKNVFKVPTLRNIALTAPYFHDGSAATLHQAISTMSNHNLGIKLSKHEIKLLVAFLKTLSGKLSAESQKL